MKKVTSIRFGEYGFWKILAGYLLGWRYIKDCAGTFQFDWTPEGYPIYTGSISIYQNFFTGNERHINLD